MFHHQFIPDAHHKGFTIRRCRLPAIHQYQIAVLQCGVHAVAFDLDDVQIIGVEVAAFGNLEQVFFATLSGWTASARMNKKTHAKGKEPIAFQGDSSAFMRIIGEALEWYHKRPQYGRLNGASPNEMLRGFIEQGWGKTALSRPELLALAFSEEVERVPDRGRVSYTPRRGNTIYDYADEPLGYAREITLRVPAFNPEFVFCFDGDELICQAFPERT